jgi:enoyl-CoA hydratase
VATEAFPAIIPPMPAGTLRLDRRDAVAILTIDRPEVHNAIDAATASAITDAVETVSADDAVRAVVVTGAGGKAFCAGADLRDVSGLMARPGASRSGWLGFSWLDLGKPSIAAIEGYCIGGGIELACWSDVRIAGRDAVFGALNRRVGVPWIDGGTQRLPRIVGLGNALYLMESAERIGAERALQMGLLQEVVEAGAALDRAIELAQRIAAFPRQSLLADRRGAHSTFGLPLAEGLELEQKLGGQAATDPELGDAVQRFIERDRTIGEGGAAGTVHP